MDYNVRIEEELFPFYALGALTDEEQAEVEAYLAANPDARARLDDMSLGVEALAMTVAPITPSPDVREQLMSRITAAPQPTGTATQVQSTRIEPASTEPRPSWFSRFRSTPPASGSSRSVWPVVAWACSLLLVFGLGWATLSLRNQLGAQQDQVAALQSSIDGLTTDNAALAGQLAQQQTEVTAALEQIDTLTSENILLREELISQSEQLAFYREPGTVTMSIGSISDAVPGATATLARMPESDTVVMRANNLPELDAARDYQLWLIADGVPISAGVFDAGPDGQATLEVAGGLPANLQAIGVSVEPAGGSDQPTPDQIIMLGEVTS